MAQRRQRDGARLLALVSYALVMLVGAPIASVTLNGSTKAKPKQIMFSPIECTALGLEDFSSSLEPLTPVLLAPSAVFKHAVKMARHCYQTGTDCGLRAYFDFEAALVTSRSELKQLRVVIEEAFTHNQRYVLYTGSMVLLLGALGALIKPVKASVLGYPLMAAAIYCSKPAGFLAAFAMVFFLAAFAINDLEDFKRLPRMTAMRRARQEVASRKQR